MNNAHLKDLAYLEEIKKIITENIQRYAVPVYNLDQLSEMNSEDIQFTISVYGPGPGMRSSRSTES